MEQLLTPALLPSPHSTQTYALRFLMKHCNCRHSIRRHFYSKPITLYPWLHETSTGLFLQAFFFSLLINSIQDFKKYDSWNRKSEYGVTYTEPHKDPICIVSYERQNFPCTDTGWKHRLQPMSTCLSEKRFSNSLISQWLLWQRVSKTFLFYQWNRTPKYVNIFPMSVCVALVKVSVLHGHNLVSQSSPFLPVRLKTVERVY